MEFEIFEKEYDIANMKIDSYFENSMSNFIAVQEVYGESMETNDLKFVIESEDKLGDKIKKVFAAIIEAIKQFTKKISNAVQAKIREIKVKMISRKVTSKQIAMLKAQLKAGNINKNAYKQIVDLMKVTQKLIEEYNATTFKATAKLKSAKSAEEVQKIIEEVRFDREKWEKKLDVAEAFEDKLSPEDRQYIGCHFTINDCLKISDMVDKAGAEAEAIIKKFEAEAEKYSKDDEDELAAKKVEACKQAASNASIAQKCKICKFHEVTNFLIKCMGDVCMGIGIFLAGTALHDKIVGKNKD